MPDVTMPRLSDSMEEGTLLRWLKSDGDSVEPGDELAEIETDKATMTYEAESGGVLSIVAVEGATLRVGEVMATLASGNGSGPAAVSAPAERGTAKGDVTVEEPTRAQQTIARRMAESRATVPDFSLRTVVDMEEAAASRARLSGVADPVPSFADFAVKAAALALKEFPRANAAYKDGRFELYSRINVGLVVPAQDALVAPTIFDADRKGLQEIAREARALAGRILEGSVTSPQLSGGTFTVSPATAEAITPVINPPQAAILGVGAVTPRAVAVGDRVVVRHRAELTLVCDHRILYGEYAERFLARIRELLETPVALAL